MLVLVSGPFSFVDFTKRRTSSSTIRAKGLASKRSSMRSFRTTPSPMLNYCASTPKRILILPYEIMYVSFRLKLDLFNCSLKRSWQQFVSGKAQSSWEAIREEQVWFWEDCENTAWWTTRGRGHVLQALLLWRLYCLLHKASRLPCISALLCNTLNAQCMLQIAPFICKLLVIR